MDMCGSTQRILCLKIVAVYISPFTLLACPLAVKRFDKSLIICNPWSQITDGAHYVVALYLGTAVVECRGRACSDHEN